jgi:SHS2 domain-containing protein
VADKNYELIEHTADIGIRVKAKDLPGLFKNAAGAMFEIIAEKNRESKKQKKIKLKQQADNLEELFINWLNELLSLSAVKKIIFTDYQIHQLEKNSLEAILIGQEMKDFKINTEVKAATYHQLKIEKTDSGWQAEVIFDV